jgi:hypothetical protein
MQREEQEEDLHQLRRVGEEAHIGAHGEPRGA